VITILPASDQGALYQPW